MEVEEEEEVRRTEGRGRRRSIKKQNLHQGVRKKTLYIYTLYIYIYLYTLYLPYLDLILTL